MQLARTDGADSTRTLRTFGRFAAANLLAVAIAVAPLLALDALYVWGGQRPDSVYFANWPNALALVVGFAIIVAGNWWAGRGLPGASRTVIAVVMAVLVWALASVPALFFMYWFHFAVGGSE